MLSELLEAAQRRPLRVNVHLRLPDAVEKVARNLNQTLLSQTTSSVDFRPASLHQPHLTLSMGFVAGPDDLAQTAEAVASLAASLAPVRLEVTGASRSPSRDEGFVYTFLDVTASEALLELRGRVHDTVSPRYVDVGRAPYPFSPHVTVGYVAATASPHLGPVPRSTATADRLGLALAGDHGVCLGRLGEYPLSAGA